MEDEREKIEKVLANGPSPLIEPKTDNVVMIYISDGGFFKFGIPSNPISAKDLQTELARVLGVTFAQVKSIQIFRDTVTSEVVGSETATLRLSKDDDTIFVRLEADTPYALTANGRQFQEGVLEMKNKEIKDAKKKNGRTRRNVSVVWLYEAGAKLNRT